MYDRRMQTTLGIETGEPNHERLREHSADFTPLPVVRQMLDLVWGLESSGYDTFIESQGCYMLDPGVGAGVFGQAMGMHPGFSEWTRTGVEIREEETAAARHYDNLRFGDALSKETLKWYAHYDLIATNPPFHLWKEYVRTFLRSGMLRAGGVLAMLGLCSWGQRSAGGVEVFKKHPPTIQARITGTIGFRGPGTNPKTQKKWGSDTRDYCWWIWLQSGKGSGWSTINLPLLPASDRRWKSRPGTDHVIEATGTNSSVPPLVEVDLRNEALISAGSHVYRQQTAGKHEQDRADATEWLRKYGRLAKR